MASDQRSNGFAGGDCDSIKHRQRFGRVCLKPSCSRSSGTPTTARWCSPSGEGPMWHGTENSQIESKTEIPPSMVV